MSNDKDKLKLIFCSIVGLLVGEVVLFTLTGEYYQHSLLHLLVEIL